MGVFVLSIAPPWFSYTNLTNKYSFLPCFAIYGILSIPFLVLRGLLCSNPCIHFASSDFLSCTHVTVFHTRLLYSCPQLLSLGSSTLTFRTLSAGCLYYRSCLPTFPWSILFTCLRLFSRCFQYWFITSTFTPCEALPPSKCELVLKWSNEHHFF